MEHKYSHYQIAELHFQYPRKITQLREITDLRFQNMGFLRQFSKTAHFSDKKISNTHNIT